MVHLTWGSTAFYNDSFTNDLPHRPDSFKKEVYKNSQRQDSGVHPYILSSFNWRKQI